MVKINNPQYLKGYWKLNSNSDDYSGNEIDGTWTGTTNYSINKFGKIIADLDGSSTITHASIATDTVCYWLDNNFYAYNGTTYYLNGDETTAFTLYSSATRF